jgi:hypothetical protein
MRNVVRKLANNSKKVKYQGVAVKSEENASRSKVLCGFAGDCFLNLVQKLHNLLTYPSTWI